MNYSQVVRTRKKPRGGRKKIISGLTSAVPRLFDESGADTGCSLAPCSGGPEKGRDHPIPVRGNVGF